MSEDEKFEVDTSKPKEVVTVMFKIPEGGDKPTHKEKVKELVERWVKRAAGKN
jgi:hypothetical protein